MNEVSEDSPVRPQGRRGNLYVVSGPSGAGKGTLVTILLGRVPGVTLSTSCTTRSPRAGEAHGREYYFLSKDEFEECIDSHGLLEWAELYGYYYGTPKHEVEEAMAAGMSILLEIDVQGARQVMRTMPEAITIFIAPPSIEELEKRLRSRGSEDESELEKRMAIAADEIAAADGYDYVIVNDDLRGAGERLVQTIERCERER